MSPALKLAVAAMLGFLLGLSIESIWRPAPADVQRWGDRVAAYQKDSSETAKVVALLQGEKARLEDSARTLETERAEAVARADEKEAQANQAQGRANAATARLAAAMTLRDSFNVMVTAYNERTVEATALRGTVMNLRAGMSKQISATFVLRSVTIKADSITNRVTNRLRIADDLLRDRPANDRCRMLWFNCPSRTTTFVVGAVLGVAGGLYVASR